MAVTFHLPPETLRIIFENLDDNRPALYALSLTSRLFNLEATRLLYRKVVIDDGTRSYSFLAKIQRRPRLAAIIHTYHTPLTVHSQKRPFWPLLVRCLLLMTGLKELAYRAIWVDPKSVFPVVRKGHPFPFQLERFIWTAERTLYSFTHVHEIEVVQFFETQHKLHSFLWANSLLSRTIPTSHFANLKIVEGSIHVIRMLVPSRPTIAEVYWRDCCRGDLEIFIRDEALLNRDGVFAHLRGLSVLEDALQPFLIHIRHPRSLESISDKVQVLELSLDFFQTENLVRSKHLSNRAPKLMFFTLDTQYSIQIPSP